MSMKNFGSENYDTAILDGSLSNICGEHPGTPDMVCNLKFLASEE